MPTPNLLAQRLAVVQSFKETTWGTAGAATAKWMGLSAMPTFTPFRKATVFDEARGSVAPGFLSGVLKKGGTFKMGGLLTYEDVIFLGHGFFGIVSPSGTNPYTYAYLGANAAQATLQTYTFEWSQAGSLARATGCVFNKLSIKGSAAGELRWEGSGFCQDIDPAWSGSLASLSDRTVEVALMPSTALALDVSGGTIGTTAFANTLTDWTLEMENGLNPVDAAGSLTPQNWVTSDRWKSTLSLSLLYTSAVRTYLNSTVMAGTGILAQIKPTSGAKSLTFNFAGVQSEDIELYGEAQGAQLGKVKFGAKYDSAAALYTNMTAINAVSAVP